MRHRFRDSSDRRFEADEVDALGARHLSRERGRTGILMSYGCGTRARAFAARDDAERVRVTRERLERAFEGLAPTERHHSFIWDDEECSRAADVAGGSPGREGGQPESMVVDEAASPTRRGLLPLRRTTEGVRFLHFAGIPMRRPSGDKAKCGVPLAHMKSG